MSTQPRLQPVRLEGEELEHMRKILHGAEGHLREIAEVVFGKLHTNRHSRKRLKHAKFIFDNVRVVIEDEDGCGVYEDPPGICRPCKPGE